MLEELEPTGQPGVYTTSEPVPIGGTWKTLIRMSNGNTLSALPIFLPEDPAIPAEGVAADPRFERAFVSDHAILQREQKDAAGWLTTFAYLVVAGIALALLVLIAWALHRLAVAGETEATEEPAERTVAGRGTTPTGTAEPRPA